MVSDDKSAVKKNQNEYKIKNTGEIKTTLQGHWPQDDKFTLATPVSFQLKILDGHLSVKADTTSFTGLTGETKLILDCFCELLNFRTLEQFDLVTLRELKSYINFKDKNIAASIPIGFDFLLHFWCLRIREWVKQNTTSEKQLELCFCYRISKDSYSTVVSRKDFSYSFEWTQQFLSAGEKCGKCLKRTNQSDRNYFALELFEGVRGDKTTKEVTDPYLLILEAEKIIASFISVTELSAQGLMLEVISCDSSELIIAIKGKYHYKGGAYQIQQDLKRYFAESYYPCSNFSLRLFSL